MGKKDAKGQPDCSDHNGDNPFGLPRLTAEQTRRRDEYFMNRKPASKR